MKWIGILMETNKNIRGQSYLYINFKRIQRTSNLKTAWASTKISKIKEKTKNK